MISLVPIVVDQDMVVLHLMDGVEHVITVGVTAQDVVPLVGDLIDQINAALAGMGTP